MRLTVIVRVESLQHSMLRTCNFYNNSEQVVKVIWEKAASPPHMDSSIVFARCRQCAPLSNTCFLAWCIRVHNQTASRSVQPFFCRAHNCDNETDIAHHATRSVTIGRICVVLRCDLKICNTRGPSLLNINLHYKRPITCSRVLGTYCSCSRPVNAPRVQGRWKDGP